MLFLFRPYQVMGLDRKLFLATFFAHCLDALCRVGLRLYGTGIFRLSGDVSSLS